MKYQYNSAKAENKHQNVLEEDQIADAKVKASDIIKRCKNR